MSNKIPAYAGMTAVIVFQAAVGVCKGFSPEHRKEEPCCFVHRYDAVRPYGSLKGYAL